MRTSHTKKYVNTNFMQDNLLILMEKQQQKSTHSKALEDSLNKTYTSEILQAVK